MMAMNTRAWLFGSILFCSFDTLRALQLLVANDKLVGDATLTKITSALTECLFHFPRPDDLPISTVRTNPNVLISETAFEISQPNATLREMKLWELMLLKNLKCFAIATVFQDIDPANPLEALTDGLGDEEMYTFSETIKFYPKVFLFFGAAENTWILEKAREVKYPSFESTLLSLDLQLQRTYVIFGNCQKTMQVYSIEYGREMEVSEEREVIERIKYRRDGSSTATFIPLGYDYVMKEMLVTQYNFCNWTACDLSWKLDDNLLEGKQTLWNAFPMGRVGQSVFNFVYGKDKHNFMSRLVVNSLLILPKTNGTHKLHPQSQFKLTMMTYTEADDVFDDVFAFVTPVKVYNAYEEEENAWKMLVDPQDGATWLLTFMSIVGVAGVVAAGRAAFWRRSLGFCAVSLAALLDQWEFNVAWRGRSFVAKAALALPCFAFFCMLILVNNGYKSMIHATYITSKERYETMLLKYTDFGNESFHLISLMESHYIPICDTSIDIRKTMLFRVFRTSGPGVCKEKDASSYAKYWMQSGDYASFSSLTWSKKCPICGYITDGLSLDMCNHCARTTNDDRSSYLQAFENMTQIQGANVLPRFLRRVYNETVHRHCPYCAELAQSPIAFLMLRVQLPYYWPLFLEHMKLEKNVKFAYTGKLEENNKISAFPNALAQRAPGAQYLLRRLKLLRSSGILAHAQKLYTLQHPPDGLPKFVETKDEHPDPKAIEKESKAVMVSFGILFIGFAVAYAIYGLEQLYKWHEAIQG